MPCVPGLAMLRDMPRHARQAILLLLGVACGAGSSAAEREVLKLEALSPLASSTELVDRLLTPITQDRVGRFSAASGVALKEQSIQLGRETFDVFVPEAAEGGGPYGLLVFVWPADGINPPADWWSQFRQRRMIYVAARGTGNSENVFDRRVPLVLHGYELARARFRVDPARVYVGGFSGGSRVAERVALAYPDVFRGVLLVGGSDPLGTAGFTPPRRSLMRQFQTSTRVVFSTGERDLPNRAKDARARDSLGAFCVAGLFPVVQARLDHWVPSGRGFARALEALETPVDPAASHPACIDRLDRSIQAELAATEAHIERGDVSAARQALIALDALYGGLAAPASVELARRIEAASAGTP